MDRLRRSGRMAVLRSASSGDSVSSRQACRDPTTGRLATVTVSAKRALGEVQIEVTDRGRGIPCHVQAHIFDRFVGRDRGGPGLGLALVKALVELHGGWVALESEPGKGAKFTLHLPEAAAQDAGAPELF